MYLLVIALLGAVLQQPRTGISIALDASVRPKDPAQIELTAQVTGKIVHNAKTAPRELLVRFEESALGAPRFAGEVACPITGDTFECALPAGKLNLRLRPRGFIGHFRGDVVLKAGEVHDLGTLEMREGQAITGRIELPREYQREVSKVVVTATPVMAQPIDGARLLPIRTRAEKNGFFHVDGVAPGAYVVRAEYEQKLFSDSVEVEVRAAREAELIDKLRLDVPRRIRLTLAPAVSPGGASWHVAIEKHVGEREVTNVSESSATLDGEWTSPPLQPGQYDILVRTRRGEQWSRQTITVGREDVQVVTALVPRSVRGEVKLGDKPLQASLEIAGKSGFSVNAKSDERGRFDASLPMTDDARWTVDIRAAVPNVNRRVSVEAPAQDGTLTIELPNSVLMGTVVHADGTPVPDALVNVVRGNLTEGMIQTEAARDGSFVIHGLAAGAYTLLASDFLAESEPLPVEIRDDETPQPVQLVIRRMNELRGRVVSAVGPVAGASVLARAVDADHAITSRRPTNARGEFGVAVPAAARRFEVNIAAPGFAYVMTSAVLGERPLVVNVDQRGGTITVRRKNGEEPYLVHNNATRPVRGIEFEWPARTAAVDGAQETVIPSMEPGAYSACLVSSVDEFRKSAGRSGGRCVSGFLAPLGSLTLDLR